MQSDRLMDSGAEQVLVVPGSVKFSGLNPENEKITRLSTKGMAYLKNKIIDLRLMYQLQTRCQKTSRQSAIGSQQSAVNSQSIANDY